MRQPTVVVMAKSPVAGRVKTRCCPPCTPTQAAELAAAALADTLDAVAGCAATRRVVALDGQPGPWLPAGYTVIEQRGDGLGARIDHVLAEVGPPVVLIGMDTPQVTSRALDHALRLVTDEVSDAVVGRAWDGGFWALGLAVAVPGLCTAVPMSTPTTGNRLRAALRDRGVGWLELGELTDFDDVETAAVVAASVPGSRFGDAFDAIAMSWSLAS